MSLVGVFCHACSKTMRYSNWAYLALYILWRPHDSTSIDGAQQQGLGSLSAEQVAGKL